MIITRHSTLFILAVAAVLTPLKANAVEPCEIIEASINYRYATHERDICAKDKYLEQTYCLRRKNGRSFLSTEQIDLTPSDENIETPRLNPTFKLDARVKETIKKDRRDISISRSVLNGREKTEAADTKDDSIATLVATFANTDVIGHYYGREIQRWSKTKGPTHPKVIELEKKYERHKIDHEIAVSKTTEQLKAEVDSVDRSHFDLLSSEYSKHLHVNDKITQVLGDWKKLSWQSSLDCTDKIRPKNPMLVRSGEDHIIVQTGKKIPSYLLQHPPTFFARRLALTSDSKYAIIQFYSHGGGSSYSLGRQLPMYLLEDVKGEWRVIAAHYAVPTFY